MNAPSMDPITCNRLPIVDRCVYSNAMLVHWVSQTPQTVYKCVLCPPLLLQVANASFDTLTLARYICESSLQVYKFVPVKASLLAAAAMYLALRMKNLGGWVSSVVCLS